MRIYKGEKMDAQIIGFKESKEVDQKINDIYENYLKFMAECVEDTTLRNAFEKDPRKYLVERVGLTIPDGVPVILDPSGSRWPSIQVLMPGGKQIAIQEKDLGIKSVEKLASGEEITETWELKKPGEIDVAIHTTLKESNVVIVMPYLTPSNDVFGDYKFDDNSEIILTCA